MLRTSGDTDRNSDQGIGMILDSRPPRANTQPLLTAMQPRSGPAIHVDENAKPGARAQERNTPRIPIGDEVVGFRPSRGRCVQKAFTIADGS